jgi:2-dehydro-3-deoxygluconokinase
VKAEPLTKPAVDTTAAGDSFAAAYIAARLAGSDPIDAARAGHRLAGVVVGYPGAIIPRYAMPARKTPRSASSRKVSR